MTTDTRKLPAPALLKYIQFETLEINSQFLERTVQVDFYLPKQVSASSAINLLLINDGQDLHKFKFAEMLDLLYDESAIEPLLCVGIHCGADRKMEYGTVKYLDFNQRGAKAALHQQFVFEELIPHIRKTYNIPSFKEKSYAGFSLGGLTALDVVWNHPHEFVKAGVFSGSLWWRLKDLNDGYVEETDRIMHKQVREGYYAPWLKFYFTTGSLDETMDRNNNGIIDSIDDTLALIEELEKKGYKDGVDICYVNYEDGKHDVPTWGRSMPAFLKWGWGHGSNK
jgi:enterochelin esterase-like enzyme